MRFLSHVFLNVVVGGWTPQCSEFWVSKDTAGVNNNEIKCVKNNGECLKDTEGCGNNNRVCPNRFYSSAEGLGNTPVTVCDRSVCADATDFDDLQQFVENSTSCSFKGNCSVGDIHAFDCKCNNVLGYTGPTCNTCLNSAEYVYPNCNEYSKYKECKQASEEHPSCKSITSLSDCQALSSVQLETDGPNEYGRQPFWYLCKRMCGYCQVNQTFESLCPTGPVSREDLVRDIHDVDLNDRDNYNCNGQRRLFKRSIQHMCQLDVSQITDFSQLFQNCQDSYINYQTIQYWDVSNGTTFSFMFLNSSIAAINLNAWDTGNAVDMNGMFKDSTFNGNIANWNVTGVSLFTLLFGANVNFNFDLRHWTFDSYNGSNGFWFSRSAVDRPLLFKDLHSLDFFPRAASTFQAGRVPLNAESKLDAPPCWISYDVATNETEFKECNSGVNKTGCQCLFEPFNSQCSSTHINNLNLKCSTQSEVRDAIEAISTVCPDLNQGNSRFDVPADNVQFSCSNTSGSNCYFKCNPDIYDVATCEIDFSNSSTSTIHAEYTCSSDGKVQVPSTERMLAASQYCQATCKVKEYTAIDQAVHACKYRPDCVGLQALNNCGSTINTIEALEVQQNTNYTLCTRLQSASTCTGPANVCVVDFQEVKQVNISHLTTSTTTTTNTFSSTTHTTSTTTTITTDIGPIDTINFDKLPTKKSVLPVVVLSALFAVILGSSFVGLFCRKQSGEKQALFQKL